MPRKKPPPHLRIVGTPDQEPPDAWTALACKYPKHPALAEEAVYALPMRLIDLICQNVPGVLEPNDEQFERDLAAASSTGFFRQQPIDFPPLFPEVGPAQSPDETNETADSVRQLLVEDMLRRGVARRLVDEVFTSAAEERESVNEWTWGYAGWLATCSDFRQELDALREQSADAVYGARLPGIPYTLTGRSGAPENSDQYQAVWLPFYQRWGIDRMATWELPVPMRPEISTPSLYDMADVSAAGVQVFIPWFLMRRKFLDIHALAERQQLVHLPRGLTEWLNPSDKNWGEKRYSVILRLYVYLELVLNRRYHQRLRRKTGKVDLVFAQVLCDRVDHMKDEETIRKIRQHMMKRIRCSKK